MDCPIKTAVSGPSAGVIVQQVGLEKIITFDIGGTSIDVSLIEDGKAQLSNPFDQAALEMEFPLILVQKYGLRPDSGGPGKFRGGLGIERVYEAVEDDVIYTGLGDRQRFEPWGLYGGQNGAGGRYFLTRAGSDQQERLTSKCTGLVLQKGDVVQVLTPGAGGWGDAKLRDPEKVLRDVMEGNVSLQSAEQDYGVALSGGPGKWEVDVQRTEQLRTQK